MKSEAEAREFEAVGGGFIVEKMRMEEDIRKSGVPVTFVCSGLFAESVVFIQHVSFSFHIRK